MPHVALALGHHLVAHISLAIQPEDDLDGPVALAIFRGNAPDLSECGDMNVFPVPFPSIVNLHRKRTKTHVTVCACTIAM